MKWYQFAISETVYREVWIEAGSEEEAREKAMRTEVGKAKRDICLLEVDYEDH